MAEITFGEAKIKAVGDLMREDDRVVIIGGAGFGGLLHSKFVQPLHDEFDSRILRTPIAELGFCGMGVGAAIAGLYPIVTIGTGSFAFEAWPQIVNEAPNICYMSGGQVRSLSCSTRSSAYACSARLNIPLARRPCSCRPPVYKSSHRRSLPM